MAKRLPKDKKPLPPVVPAESDKVIAKATSNDKQPLPTVVQVGPLEGMAEATGTEEWHLQQQLFNQVHDTIWQPENQTDYQREIRVNSMISMLQGIEPTDGVEGLLAAQMVATYNVAMEYLRRAMIPTQSSEGADQSLKHATKLLSIFSRQIEVLDKHRGKGQQKITVGRVNVEEGGQAIVGHVEAGKTDGSPKKRGKPRTKEITNNPDESINMDLKVSQTKSRKKT